MQGVLLVLVPAIIISLGVATFKLKFPNFSLLPDVFNIKLPINLLVILALAITSTFSINYIYCDLLQTECKPDALSAVGYIFHSILVFISSTLLVVLF
jgi:hypothetical protein